MYNLRLTHAATSLLKSDNFRTAPALKVARTSCPRVSNNVRCFLYAAGTAGSFTLVLGPSTMARAKLNAKAELESFASFVSDEVFTLRTLEWSGDIANDPLIQSVVEDFEAEEVIDFACCLALFPNLYTDQADQEFDRTCYVPLEAFIWSLRGRRMLSAVGWLEGNVVSIDHNQKAVKIPQVDEPEVTPCLPNLWPIEKIDTSAAENRIAGVQQVIRRFGQVSWTDSLTSSLNQLSKRSRMINVLLQHIGTVAEKIYKAEHQQILGQLKESSREIARAIDSIIDLCQQFSRSLLGSRTLPDDIKELLTPDSIGNRLNDILVDRLTHFALSKHISDLRLRADDFEARKEFEEFFIDRKLRKTAIERQSNVLFVSDAELTLLTAESVLCKTAEERRSFDMGGRKHAYDDMKQEQFYKDFGLLRPERGSSLTDRGKQLLRWVESVVGNKPNKELGLADNDIKALAERWEDTFLFESAHKRTTKGGKYAELEAFLTTGKKDFARLQGMLSCLEKRPWNRTVRNAAVIDEEHRANIAIHRLLRFGELCDRNLIAFPLGHFGENSRRAKRVNLYFVGTFSRIGGLPLRRHIGLLRDFANQFSISQNREDLLRQLEDKEHSLRMFFAAHVFGHDLKNRLAEIAPRQLLGKVRSLRDSSVADTDRQEIYTDIETAAHKVASFYGIPELFSEIGKISRGSLPDSWRDGQLGDWPPSEIAKRLLQRYEDAIRSYVLDTALPYSLQSRRLRVYEVRSTGSCEPSSPCPVSSPPKLPPLKEGWKTVSATLAGVSEIMRNACRYVLHEENSPDIAQACGELPIYFSLHTDYEDSSVELSVWNPFTDDSIEPSKTIDRLKSVYDSFCGVEISNLTSDPAIPFQPQTEIVLPFARATFRISPGHLRFA